MRYRKLGRTGFDVSEIGCGLWGMSGWSGSDDAESLQAMQIAVDSGCNFLIRLGLMAMARAMRCWGKSLLRIKASGCMLLRKFRRRMISGLLRRAMLIATFFQR